METLHTSPGSVFFVHRTWCDSSTIRRAHWSSSMFFLRRWSMV